MKNMKKTLLMILAMMLVCAISVAATVAYFASKTELITNTFTFGNVDIDLKEDTPDGEVTEGESGSYENVTPGSTYKKAPKIENTGSEVAWVRMTIKYNAAAAAEFGTTGDTNDTALPLESLLVDKEGKSTIDTTKWKEIGTYTVGSDTVYVYDYRTKLNPETATDPLFDEFTIPAGWEPTNAEGNSNHSEFITVYGYAIQASNIDNLDGENGATDLMNKQWPEFAPFLEP